MLRNAYFNTGRQRFDMLRPIALSCHLRDYERRFLLTDVTQVKNRYVVCVVCGDPREIGHTSGKSVKNGG